MTIEDCIRWDGNKRIYTFEGKDYKLSELARHPESVVDRATLSGRIVNALNWGKINTRWTNLRQCLTTPIAKGFHSSKAKPGTFISEPVDLIEHVIATDKFVHLNHIWKAGSLHKKARIMQSKPIMRK